MNTPHLQLIMWGMVRIGANLLCIDDYLFLVLWYFIIGCPVLLPAYVVPCFGVNAALYGLARCLNRLVWCGVLLCCLVPPLPLLLMVLKVGITI